MDAITLLKDDHRAVEKLFKDFERAGDRAYARKRDLVERMIEGLSRHAAVEEQLFYPVTRQTVPAVQDLALESLEEHHIVKWQLAELEGLDPEDERFNAKVTVLIENVRHHVKEEEGDYFPKVRDELGRKALAELGDALADARKTAPTHPHPMAPQTPPGNIVAGNAAAVVDRMSDTISGIAQGSIAAVQDLAARVSGSKRPRSSPNGTSTARKTATTVRSASAESIDRAVERVREAHDAGERVAKRAATTGRRTTKAAGTGARKTARTAKRGARETAGTARDSASGTARTARRAARGA